MGDAEESLSSHRFRSISLPAVGRLASSRSESAAPECQGHRSLRSHEEEEEDSRDLLPAQQYN